MDTPVRLNKHLAHSLGISRRQADAYIEQGRVRINGHTAQIGNVIHPGRDQININNQDVVARPHRYTYLLLNKPIGYVCSRKQQGNTPTIYSLLPRQYHHLKVAGRLDKDSCGLVLLTDDGDTIFKLTHPKFGKQKTYHVGLNKPLSADDKKHIEKGVQLEDGISKLTVTVIPAQAGIQKKPNFYKVTMREGRNRQIRRTFKQLGYSVTHLERQLLGSYKLSNLSTKVYAEASAPAAS